MKKYYEKLGLAPIDVLLENSVLAASILVDRTVTVEEFKSGFEGDTTLENPGIVEITFK